MTSFKGNMNLTKRDVAIFHFLWRFKVSTTHALKIRFFADASMRVAYRRLWQLESYGFIRLLVEPEAHHCVWTLSDRGFKEIKSLHPYLTDHGYKSESISHDLLVAAVMLGEFLPKTPSKVQMFTEQELRRYNPIHFPAWVPEDKSYRPDGYWRIEFDRGPKTIALELELSRKKLVDYECIAEFYLANPVVDRSLWVVRQQGLADSIIQSFIKATKGNSFNHDFVLLNHFLEKQWLAPVIFGPHKNEPLSMVLGITRENLPHICVGQALLDSRKAPIVSPISKPLKIDDFSI